MKVCPAIASRSVLAAAGLIAAAQIGCSGDPGGPTELALSPAIVSAPALSEGSSGTATSVRALNPGTAYISMVPGTEPTGTTVTIRNASRAGGEPITAPMVDGGFDPVSIEVEADDSLLIDVQRPDGASLAFARVPRRSRPVVVRTRPANRRTDVVLNPLIQIVFNEPMDGATLGTAVRLLRGDEEVAGAVIPVSSGQDVLLAEFVPTAPLLANTEYQLEVGTTALARSGAALESAVTATFGTGTIANEPLSSSSGSLGIVTVTSGSNLDFGGFDYAIDGASTQKIGLNDRVLARLPSGAHVVTLSGLRADCSTEPSGPREVVVRQSLYVELQFRVTCGTGTGPAQLVIMTSTSGSDMDPDGFGISIDGGPPVPVGVTDNFTRTELVPGAHEVAISGLSAQCFVAGVTPRRTFLLRSGETRTETFNVVCAPDFQPAGTLAFVRDLGAERSAIFLSNPDGSDQRQVTDGLGRDFDPAWSPDGQRLAFICDRNGDRDICIVNAGGSDLSRRAVDGMVQAPAWSPDGSSIAFSRYDANAIQIVNLNDGSISGGLGLLDAWNGEPAWSPADTEIVFVSDVRDGFTTSDLFLMNPDGSGIRSALSGEERGYGPQWSPDGQRIAFALNPLATVSREHWIAVADRAGSTTRVAHIERVRAIRSWADNSPRPAWSPDGTTIAFESMKCRVALYCIRYAKLDGSGSSITLEEAHSPAWRP